MFFFFVETTKSHVGTGVLEKLSHSHCAYCVCLKCLYNVFSFEIQTGVETESFKEKI